ncbi:restriction endonuclease subunit S [Pseudomonas laurylsulfatiphila]
MDWQVHQLGDLSGSIASGRSKVDAEFGQFPVFGSTGVIGYTNTPSHTGVSILVARVGANAGSLNSADGRYGVTDNTISIRFKPGVDHAYCLFQLKRYGLNRLIFGSGQPLITGTQLKGIPIPTPSPAEQKKIVSALSDIETLVSGLDQLIAKKRDIQQAAMQQLLTGQRLPGFSGEWKDGEFRDVVRSLEAGVSVNSTDDLPEPGLPCVLKTSALSGGIFFPNEAKAIVAADRGRACTNPKRNTILISRMNTPALVGEIAYVEKDYDWLFLPDRLWITQFMSDDCVNVRWLAYLLSSRPYRKLLRDSATGTSGSMKNISKGALLNLQIRYPAIEEQTAIATILSDMDAELATLEARREKARQLKQGMMQELLTGRIRLA